MSRYFQLLISEEFAERRIPEDDSVRLLDQIVDELDLHSLACSYSRMGRKSATSPRTLLKIMIYANMEGIYSSRSIESSCKRDINFIWLLNGEKAPNYREIARFRSERLSECGEDLFYQLVKKLSALGEIKFEHLFVDGTKIEANANKYSFVWRKTTNKYEARLHEKLDKLIPALCLKYMVQCDNAEQLIDMLKSKVDFPFVYGRGKRKSELQRDIEQLSELVTRKKKYEKYQATFSGRNSFSKTDPDATFMHLKEDHMRNAQLKPAYNLQLGVEGEYVTGFDISSERSDQFTLIPLIDKMDKNIGVKYQDVTADAGYESEENLSFLRAKGIEAYIKPANYEQLGTKKFAKEIGRKENMRYDKEQDCYLCHNGKEIKRSGSRKVKTASGYIREETQYACSECGGCPYKEKCMSGKNWKKPLEERYKKLTVSRLFEELREEEYRRIHSEEGKKLRMNRSIQAEGGFADIKGDSGFTRFLCKGNENVFAEYILYAMAHNLGWLHSRIQNDKLDLHLYELKEDETEAA